MMNEWLRCFSDICSRRISADLFHLIGFHSSSFFRRKQILVSSAVMPCFFFLSNPSSKSRDLCKLITTTHPILLEKGFACECFHCDHSFFFTLRNMRKCFRAELINSIVSSAKMFKMGALIFTKLDKKIVVRIPRYS